MGIPGRPGRRQGNQSFSLLREPQGLASDPFGNLYVADTGNNCINFLQADFGNMSTLISQAQNAATSSARSQANIIDGHGRATILHSPCSIRLNPNDGSLLIADRDGHRLRRVVTPLAAALAKPDFYKLLAPSTKELHGLAGATLANFRQLKASMQLIEQAVAQLGLEALTMRQSHFAREAKLYHSQHKAGRKADGAATGLSTQLIVLLMALPRVNNLEQLAVDPKTSQIRSALAPVLEDHVPELLQRYHWHESDVLADLNTLLRFATQGGLSVQALSYVFLNDTLQDCPSVTPTAANLLDFLGQVLELCSAGANGAPRVSEREAEVFATAVIRWLSKQQQRWSIDSPAAEAAMATLTKLSGSSGGARQGVPAPEEQPHANDAKHVFSAAEVASLWWADLSPRLQDHNATVSHWLLREQMQRLCGNTKSQLKTVMEQLPTIFLVCHAKHVTAALVDSIVLAMAQGARNGISFEWSDLAPLVAATKPELVFSGTTLRTMKAAEAAGDAATKAVSKAGPKAKRAGGRAAAAATPKLLLQQREALYRTAAAAAAIVCEGGGLSLTRVLEPAPAEFVASFLTWYRDELAMRGAHRLYAEESKEAAEAWGQILEAEQIMRSTVRQLGSHIEERDYTPAMLSAMQRAGERFFPLWQHFKSGATRDPREGMQQVVSKLRSVLGALQDVCGALLLYGDDSELLQNVAGAFDSTSVLHLASSLRCDAFSTAAPTATKSRKPLAAEKISVALAEALPWLENVCKLQLFQALWGKATVVRAARCGALFFCP